MNKTLTLVSNIFSDLNLTDMETCYKVFRKEILDQITIEENRFGFEPEITAKIGELARVQNVRVYEVGISYYARTYSEGKKIGWKDGVRAMWCIFKYNTSTPAHFSKYAVSGVFVALSQFSVMLFLVEILSFNTEALKNIANFVSIAIGLLVAFLLHSKITWRYTFNSVAEVLQRLALFYFVSIVSILIRMGAFYVFDRWGMDYKTNTLVGIVLMIAINFFGYDRFVFKKLNISTKSNVKEKSA